jgi:hypothetical protein
MQALGGQQVGWWQRAGLGAAVLRQRQYRTRSYRPRYWGSYDPYYQYYNFLWYDDDDGDDDGFDDS